MARGVATQAATEAQRDEALRLADLIGVGPAADKLGRPASTLRSWRSRRASKVATSDAAGTSGDAAAPSDWRDGREHTAGDSAAVAREAIAAARRELRRGSPHKAQAAMTAAGIALDKLAQLERQIGEADERQVRLSEHQQRIFAGAIKLYFDAVGLPFETGSPPRKLLAELVRQAGRGEPLAASPAHAQRAFADVRHHIGEELRGEIEQELHGRIKPDQRGPLALPAPSDDDSDPQPQNYAAGDGDSGGRAGNLFESGDLKPSADEEVVAAEVVTGPAEAEARAEELQAARERTEFVSRRSGGPVVPRFESRWATLRESPGELGGLR